MQNCKNIKNIWKGILGLTLVLMLPMSLALRAQDSSKDGASESQAKEKDQSAAEAAESQNAPPAPAVTDPAAPQSPVSGEKKSAPAEANKAPKASGETWCPLLDPNCALQNGVDPEVEAAPRAGSKEAKPSNRSRSAGPRRYRDHQGAFFRFLPLFGRSKLFFTAPARGEPSAEGSSILRNELAQSSNRLDYKGNVFGFEMLLGASPIDNVAFHGGLFYLDSSTLSKQSYCCSEEAVTVVSSYDYQYSFGGLSLGVTSYSMPANFYFTFQGRVVTDGEFNIISPNAAYDPDLIEGEENYQYYLEEKYVLESGNDLGYSIAFGWEGRFANREFRFLNLGVAFQYARDVMRLANYAGAADLQAEHSYYGLALSLTFF